MSEELLQQLRTLAPWHMNVALTPDIRTGDGNRVTREPGEHSMSLINPKELRPLLQRL